MENDNGLMVIEKKPNIFGAIKDSFYLASDKIRMSLVGENTSAGQIIEKMKKLHLDRSKTGLIEKYSAKLEADNKIIEGAKELSEPCRAEIVSEEGISAESTIKIMNTLSGMNKVKALKNSTRKLNYVQLADFIEELKGEERVEAIVGVVEFLKSFQLKEILPNISRSDRWTILKRCNDKLNETVIADIAKGLTATQREKLLKSNEDKIGFCKAIIIESFTDEEKAEVIRNSANNYNSMYIDKLLKEISEDDRFSILDGKKGIEPELIVRVLAGTEDVKKRLNVLDKCADRLTPNQIADTIRDLTEKEDKTRAMEILMRRIKSEERKGKARAKDEDISRC